MLVKSLPNISASANDVIAAPGDTVKLTGSVNDVDSSNPGTVDNLKWEQVLSIQSPSVGALSNAKVSGNQRTLTTTFTAPNVTYRTDYSFVLLQLVRGTLYKLLLS